MEDQKVETPKSWTPHISDERQKRLWPVVQDLLQSMLKHNILFTDREEVVKLASMCLQNMLATIVFNSQQEIVDMMAASTERTMKNVEEMFWGKEGHKVDFEDLNGMLQKWFEWQKERGKTEGVEVITPPTPGEIR